MVSAVREDVLKDLVKMRVCNEEASRRNQDLSADEHRIPRVGSARASKRI